MLRICLAAAIAATSLLTPMHSFAFFIQKERFPECHSEQVLKRIGKLFNQTEKDYWEERGLVFNRVDNTHLHSVNPWVPESPIDRRYCHGDVHFENGKSRRIHYLIETDKGYGGFGWDVEYCIHGLDPWRYYDGNCRVLDQPALR